MFDTINLIVPELRDNQDHVLTRPQLCVLEAIHLLTWGVRGGWCDEDPVRQLCRDSWGVEVRGQLLNSLAGHRLVVTNRPIRLIRAGWGSGGFHMGDHLIGLTNEGQIERYAQRSRVFA